MSLSDRIRPDVEAAPWVIEEIKKLEKENAAMKSMLMQAAKNAQWQDKHIYYVDVDVDGDVAQHYKLVIYLPVPLDEVDKSVENALEKEINSVIKNTI